ncbi:MAG: AAA family ATPase [Oscillospiraceae bacterium]|nr:AAA family ATPase [Oscillospiraceae bacterium]
MKIKIMLISKAERTLAALRAMIAGDDLAIVAESAGGASAVDKIENVQADIIVMSLDSGDPDVLSLAERVILHRPRTFVVLVSETMDMQTVRGAMKIGAHNVVDFPHNAKEFSEYLKTVYNNETIRLTAVSDNKSIAWASKVIVVFGSKGGLGKTTIATNLAVKLAESKKKVALVDLDLQFGDVHIFMGIEPKDTIAELVQDVYVPNIDAIRSYMVVHSSGVHVLCAPKSPEYADVVSSERVQGLIRLLRSYYDYVIIDTPPTFDDVTITAIEASNTLLFVTGLDISILKNSKLSISLLASLQQKEKVRIIVNRAVEINTVTMSDVQKVIGCPIWAKIPSDYKTAVSALNRGVPFTLGEPRCLLSQAVGDISRLLISGSDDFDIQKLSPREKRQLLKKYKQPKKRFHM